MENDQNEWAKAENPEVEQAKQDFAEAQQAQILRQSITQYAADAVKYGHVDRDWVNGQLARIGAQPVTGNATYQINWPIVGNYGVTVTAGSRTEALAKFAEHVGQVQAAGQVRTNHCGEGVYNVEFDPDAEPVFFSGPQDTPELGLAEALGLDGTKKAIRSMLMHGVTERGWGHSYASEAADSMGLEPLPALVHKTVNVPVSGTAEILLSVFEGSGDEAVQDAVAAFMGRAKEVVVAPEEIGSVFMPRPDGSDTSGFTLVDDGDDG